MKLSKKEFNDLLKKETPKKILRMYLNGDIDLYIKDLDYVLTLKNKEVSK